MINVKNNTDRMYDNRRQAVVPNNLPSRSSTTQQHRSLQTAPFKSHQTEKKTLEKPRPYTSRSKHPRHPPVNQVTPHHINKSQYSNNDHTRGLTYKVLVCHHTHHLLQIKLIKVYTARHNQPPPRNLSFQTIKKQACIGGGGACVGGRGVGGTVRPRGYTNS